MPERAPAPIIDAHTHIFAPDVAARRDHYRERDRWFGELHAAPTATVIQAAELLAAMDDAGVDGAVACGWPWADHGICREHNDALAEAARLGGGRIAWLATVSPGSPEAPAEAERAFRLGAAGVGELNADAQGFDLRDVAAFAPLADVCRAFDRPILLHASEPLGHAYPGKGAATPDRIAALLAAEPETKFVLAHWGGGLPFYELMPEVAELTRNVVYDTAASTYLYRPAVFRSVLDMVGPERVLWASDHPVLNMGRFLRRTRAANLRPEEVGPVLGGNAARVYRFVPGAEEGGER
jgi:uncharacterized protein